MEDLKYIKEYLSEQGPRWTFSYNFKDKIGVVREHETNISYSFRFFYKKFELLSEEGNERFLTLNENEKKWFDNCISETLSLKKQ